MFNPLGVSISANITTSKHKGLTTCYKIIFSDSNFKTEEYIFPIEEDISEHIIDIYRSDDNDKVESIYSVIQLYLMI